MKPIAMLPRTLVLTVFVSSLLAAEPDKLTKLRGSYESAMTKATAPIQKTYTTELEKLKIELTKLGNLEGALAVDAELKKISNSGNATAAPSPASIGSGKRELLNVLNDSVWIGTWEWGDVDFTFKGDSVIQQAGTKWEGTGKVEVTSARQIRMTFEQPNKAPLINTLEISKDGRSMTGTRNLKLTRKP
jgi:hypothetical protein